MGSVFAAMILRQSRRYVKVFQDAKASSSDCVFLYTQLPFRFTAQRTTSLPVDIFSSMLDSLVGLGQSLNRGDGCRRPHAC